MSQRKAIYDRREPAIARDFEPPPATQEPVDEPPSGSTADQQGSGPIGGDPGFKQDTEDHS